MKKKVLIVGLIFLMLAIGLSGCLSGRYTDYFNGEYDSTENTVFKITTFNGQIELYGWDNDTVSLNAIKRSSISQDELDKVDINVDESDDNIEIETVYTGQRVTQPAVDINLKVPTYITIDTVKTSNGAIIIENAKGNITADSSNGAITIENIDGYVTATTSNGNIDVTGTTGIKDLQTSNGIIKAEIYDFQGNIVISTSNGGITVYINPSLNADIKMQTSNGVITLNEISMNFTTNEEKYKEAILGDGGNEISLQTSNGNIKLYELNV